MIFYFSGTGNSLWVAKELNKAFNEKLISIADELNNSSNNLTYNLQSDEKIIFVFPVHSWGPAVLIPKFIRKMTLTNYVNQPVSVICTCGDECGYTDKIMRKVLERKSLRLTAAYSLKMPNNYILLPGFDTDSKEVESEKLQQAPLLLQEIVENIHQIQNGRNYTTGSLPILKSDIIYPLFCKFALKKNSFYATDQCISCGLCEEICPTKTISMYDGKPQWEKSTCVQCLACIHRCPQRAIEYGNITQKRGRYVNPNTR